jgi:hypothetical protein
MYYVYSTATCGCDYVQYQDNGSKDLGVIKKRPNGKPWVVSINGGHGVATKHMWTPKGVVTQVSDEDMEFLLSTPSFNRHMKAGFLTYDKKNVAPEKKAAMMEDGDGSKPLTPADFIPGENGGDDTKTYRTKGKPMRQMV